MAPFLSQDLITYYLPTPNLAHINRNPTPCMPTFRKDISQLFCLPIRQMIRHHNVVLEQGNILSDPRFFTPMLRMLCVGG